MLGQRTVWNKVLILSYPPLLSLPAEARIQKLEPKPPQEQSEAYRFCLQLNFQFSYY